MLSFKQLLDPPNSSNITSQSEQAKGLFTMLKKSMLNGSFSNDPHGHSSKGLHEDDRRLVEQLMLRHELEFEILKLEKANEVVMKYEATGRPIAQIVRQVVVGLQHDIYNIIKGSTTPTVQPKPLKQLQQTLPSSIDQQTAKKQHPGVQSKTHNTPKIVQFTLGNRQVSSGRQNSNPNYARIDKSGEEVSQFFVNGKAPASKSIREKVMGRRGAK